MKTVAENIGTPAEQLEAVMKHMAGTREKVPFLVPLTQIERHQHRAVKIGIKKLRTMQNRLIAAQQHRELLPPAFDLAKFEEDAELLTKLHACLKAIDEIREAVNDTYLVVGKRTVVASKTAFAHIKVGSTTVESLKRTVEKLTAPHTSRAAADSGEPVVVPLPEPAPADPAATKAA